VFGDLKALATVEARTVLGAAVAGDVIGLVNAHGGRPLGDRRIGLPVRC